MRGQCAKLDATQLHASNTPKSPKIKPSLQPSTSNTISFPPTPIDLEEKYSLSRNDEIVKNSKGHIYLNDSEIKSNICKSQYSILSVNIRSLTKNIEDLKVTVKKLNTNIIACQEIWNPHNGFVKIEGYKEILKPRQNGKRGGGLGLYIKTDLNYKNLEKLNELNIEKIEVQGIVITSTKGETQIINIYRPPDTDIKTSMKELNEVFKLADKKTIIIGDLNIDLSKCNNISRTYENELQKHNLIQKVNSYTRITHNTASIIDHTVTNIAKLTTMVTHFMISDHLAVVSCWGNFKGEKKQKNINRQVIQEQIKFKETADKIRGIDWEKWSEINKKKSTNEMYESLNETLQNCLEKSKTKMGKKGKIRQPYVTDELIRQNSELEKCRKKFLKHKSHENETRYKQLKKDYTYKLKKARNDYYANELQRESKNSKQIWANINQILNKNINKEEISEISHNGEIIKDKKTIANVFCNYYKNAAYERVIKINKSNNFKEYLNPEDKQVNTFQLEKVTKKDTWEYMSTIKPKNSAGTDRISSKIIKMTASSLVTPFTDLINKCFEESTFPTELKTSKITPIIKKDKVEKMPSNFRPINQLSGISKIIEKAAIDQLNKHFKQFENINQFGYKRQHSSYHPILLTRHYIEQELAKNKYVILIMVDLSIAFETVNTGEILPEKLKHYGATNSTIKFFNNYFLNRKHKVIWENVESETTELHNLSCVQGSALGPNIFNVYTNDLKDLCEGILIAFADDTNVIISANSLDEVMTISNTEIAKLDNYTSANDLIINKEKSSYMIFKPRRKREIETNQTIKIGNTVIPRVKQAKYLGLIIDDKLNFQPQFENLLKKLKQGINSLICTKNILNYKAKYMLYNANFKSHLDYGLVCYFDKLKKTQTQQLKKLQKKAVRLIFRAPINSHTNNLYNLSGIMPIEKLYHYEAVKLIFKNKNELIKDKQPIMLNRIITSNKKTRETRQSDNFFNIKINAEYKKGQAMYNILSEWNKANKELKQSGNIYSLKKEIKNNREILENCKTKNCEICKKKQKQGL